MTDPIRFVTTVAIRQAVDGREEEVLDAIGVDWRAGRPHIRCPYGDHADHNASWRWDSRHAKARCTCTTGDSIFDIVKKISGMTFDAAKVRVAELLNLGDLIRIKGGGRGLGQVFQSTDAASLLNPSADNRDETLPIAYLAHRLGVTPEAVPIPCTPMAGLKALGYFDPPKHGSKQKPKLIGTFPCAVFGTSAADGRTHAHRIYVQPGGRGKAELGVTSEGRPRDPKKSAKVTGDFSTAGCAVLWGDPSRAPHIIVTESIETGAVVARALLAEIEAGDIAVVAAISTSGMAAFQPYPATTRITIAADRDEAKKANGDPGSRSGERAARTLGMKHHGTITMAIAMPGAPGESVDWLDILVRDGIETVRGGIRTVERFVPAEGELEDAARARARAQALLEISAAWPLPVMNTLTLRYLHTDAGKVMVHKIIGSDADPESGRQVPVATPFGVSARLRHAGQADVYGLRCVVQDMNGKSCTVDFDRAGLARAGGAEIKAALFAAGLRTEDDGETVVLQCLKAADPDREILIVQRPGWHDAAGCRDAIFLTPCGQAIGAPDGLALELAATARMTPDVARAGTMEGWYRAVETAVSVPGCEHWTLGVLAAFAGPIIALTGLDTCGINLSGMSTSGKSTAQRLATSAWSTPDIRRSGLFQSARTTDNAVEAMAHRATGTVLSLDEIAHINGKEAAKLIYTIAGGVGKRRMTAEAQLRPSYAWATFAILSGESSLEEKVRGDGGEWMAGMAVRIIDIDVTGVNRNVDAITLRDIGVIEQNFGHAGPAFIGALIEHGLHRKASDLRDRVFGAAKTLAGGVSMDSATIRAAMPLALLLIAGELAKGFGLIPPATAAQDAVRWGWDRFRQSSDATALDPDTQVIDALRGWIAERWDVTIKNVDASTAINNRETIAWYDENIVYIPNPRLREAAGNSLRVSQVASILERQGMLAKRTEPDRLYGRSIPKVGRVASYRVRRSEVGRSERASDPDIRAVHVGGRHD